MRVEMDERQGAGAARQRAQQRECHRVVAAERDQMVQGRRLRLDLRAGVLGMSPWAMRKSPISARSRAAGSRQIAGCSPSTSMRLAWRIAAGPNRAPGPVRGAEIIGNAGDADRGVDARARNAEKRRADGKSRYRSHATRFKTMTANINMREMFGRGPGKTGPAAAPSILGIGLRVALLLTNPGSADDAGLCDLRGGQRRPAIGATYRDTRPSLQDLRGARRREVERRRLPTSYGAQHYDLDGRWPRQGARPTEIFYVFACQQVRQRPLVVASKVRRPSLTAPLSAFHDTDNVRGSSGCCRKSSASSG